jgi:hypothetical protein
MVDATEDGGPGDDIMTLAIAAPASATVVDNVDGGPGTNTCYHTPNVTVNNCAVNQVI